MSEQSEFMGMTRWAMPKNAFGYTPPQLTDSIEPFSMGADWGNSTVPSMGGMPMQTNAMGIAPTSFGSAAGPSWWDNFAGRTDNNTGITTKGWGATALGGLQAFGNMYMGAQQLKMAKQALEENRRQFNMNWDAQRTLTNSHLEDRQAARVASNPSAYQSVGEYMAKNGVK